MQEVCKSSSLVTAVWLPDDEHFIS